MLVSNISVSTCTAEANPPTMANPVSGNRIPQVEEQQSVHGDGYDSEKSDIEWARFSKVIET